MSSMRPVCGKITAHVNGFLTAHPQPSKRLKYRTMLDDILKRIEERLDAVGLSAGAASEQAGLSRDAIRNIQRAAKTGREGVSTNTLMQLAPVLKTTAAWLLEGGGNRETISVPLISWVAAGSFQIADQVMRDDDFKMLRLADLPHGDWIALQVEGDSMDRISPPASIILVDRSEKRLVTNACYIIGDGDGGATYKRYRQSPARFEPVSTNTKHEPIFPDPGNMPTIVGRVRRTILDL